MAEEKNKTVFQRLETMFGGSVSPTSPMVKKVNSYSGLNGSDVIYKTSDKGDMERKRLELRQQHLIARQWAGAQRTTNEQSLVGLTEVKLMYRDADLMDCFPEIGAALDIYMEESTYIGKTGMMVNVSSKSSRIKSILQDLLVNRLMVNTTLPMISRSTAKYGNTYMLLNMDAQNGITGWKQLPAYEMERYESNMPNPYAEAFKSLKNIDIDDANSTKFVWVGKNEYTPYMNWQIAHFRLLYDSIFLPYGCSMLHKARRHFRMLSMMEDMMLIYRLDRSMERRVFKINVAGLDEQDVKPFVDQVADNFKRTPIVDPKTGQLDLRKNIMPVWKNTPIPLADGRTITIEQLAEEYGNGRKNRVFSIKGGSMDIVEGCVAWCGKTYEAERMIKIVLEDGGYMVMDGVHEIILSDGSKVRAMNAKPGMAVMPFSGGVFGKLMRIVSVDEVMGDDVYCMTVLGENGEDDRHNFALNYLYDDDRTGDIQGCFVKNCDTNDYFIPVRDPSEPNPIETLNGAQNLTAMDDIKFIQNKVFTALRVPKSFLNFEEEKGEGKNLSMLDIRFSKTVNKMQHMLLMELNKICIIHLYLLGFHDELTNFTLYMNSPSSQAELLEVENIGKKIQIAKDAVSDAGNGIPIMSVRRAQKEILGWSDAEIGENLQALRLEKALAAELELTPTIIKRSHVFDPTDNIYGEPGAEYSEGGSGGGEGPDASGGGGFSGGFGGGFGGGFDDMGMEGEGEMGAEGEMPIGDFADQEAAMAGGGEAGGQEGAEGPEPGGEGIPNESLMSRIGKPRLDESASNDSDYDNSFDKAFTKKFFLGEELNSLRNQLDDIC